VKTGYVMLRLTKLGFRFRLDGEEIKVRFEGSQITGSVQMRDLLEVVKTHKDEVREFLRCYCPKCGGIVFVGFECFICEWQPKWAHAQVPTPEDGHTCGGCAHFKTSRVNPPQGFGHCALAHLSKRPGAYPGKTACPHFEPAVGDGTLRLAQ
jgi:hypothetical protein